MGGAVVARKRNGNGKPDARPPYTALFQERKPDSEHLTNLKDGPDSSRRSELLKILAALKQEKESLRQIINASEKAGTPEPKEPKTPNISEKRLLTIQRHVGLGKTLSLEQIMDYQGRGGDNTLGEIYNPADSDHDPTANAILDDSLRREFVDMVRNMRSIGGRWRPTPTARESLTMLADFMRNGSPREKIEPGGVLLSRKLVDSVPDELRRVVLKTEWAMRGNGGYINVDRIIAICRFYLDMTLEEIGDFLDLCRERMRQKEIKILNYLRKEPSVAEIAGERRYDDPKTHDHGITGLKWEQSTTEEKLKYLESVLSPAVIKEWSGQEDLLPSLAKLRVILPLLKEEGLLEHVPLRTIRCICRLAHDAENLKLLFQEHIEKWRKKYAGGKLSDQL